MSKRKIVITGAAGLVGQNLIPRLMRLGEIEIAGIDKHPTNCAILEKLHPEITVFRYDLASTEAGAGELQARLEGCDALVIGHAQIGGLERAEFHRNNVEATERLLRAAAACGCCVRRCVPGCLISSASLRRSSIRWPSTTTPRPRRRRRRWSPLAAFRRSF